MKDAWKNHAATAAQREQIEAVRKLYRLAKEAVESLPGCCYAERALEMLEESFLLVERGVVLCEKGDC